MAGISIQHHQNPLYHDKWYLLDMIKRKKIASNRTGQQTEQKKIQ